MTYIQDSEFLEPATIVQILQLSVELASDDYVTATLKNRRGFKISYIFLRSPDGKEKKHDYSVWKTDPWLQRGNREYSRESISRDPFSFEYP